MSSDQENPKKLDQNSLLITSNKSIKPQKQYNPKSFSAQLHRILALTKKEIKILTNDKFAMVLLLLLPITLILTINFGAARTPGPMGQQSTRVQSPIIGIIDHDHSEGYDGYDLSAEFVRIYEEYNASGECILSIGDNASEYEMMIRDGLLHAYIVIDEGFEFNLSTHFVAYFRVIVDSLNQVVFQDVESLLDETVTIFADRFNFTGAIDQNIELVNVPSKALKLFQVSPVFFPIVIFSMTCLVNSQSIIGDIPKDRMVLTPARKIEVLLGKLFGSIVINSTMVFTIWGLSLGLGMQTRGDIGIYFFILWSCALVGTAIGLFISSIANSTLSAFQYFILFFISQTILILFITNKDILSYFPIWSTGQLMMQVILQGLPLLEPSNGYLPYIIILHGEFLAFMVATYLIYYYRRSLI